MDVIGRDFENSYYADGSAPFWQWKPSSPPSTWGIYRNELIAFISSTPIPPDNCKSRLCEVKYQLYYPNSHDSNEGWLMRSVTGDRNSDGTINTKWNFFNNITASYDSSSSAFSATSASSDDYQKLIPNVIDFDVECYYVLNAPITPDTAISVTSSLTPTSFPYSVVVSITLLDQSSWKKWLILQGSSVYPGSETADARNFRLQKQQTFTRSIFIGNRGQN